MTAPARAVVAGCSVVAAVAYSSFFVAYSLNPVTAQAGFISELEAPGQPWGWFFRTTDVLAGVAIVLTTLGARTRIGGARPAGFGWALLIGVGLSSMADGLTTMSCEPVRGSACAEAQRTASGLLAQLSEPHTLTGLYGLLGAAAAAGLLGWAAREVRPGWARLSLGVGIAIASGALLELALLLLGVDVEFIERGRTVLISVWLVALGFQPTDELSSVNDASRTINVVTGDSTC